VAFRLNQQLISTAGLQLAHDFAKCLDLMRAPLQPPLDLAQVRARMTQVLAKHLAALQAQRAHRLRAALEQRSAHQPTRRPPRKPTAASVSPALASRLLDPAAFLGACACGRLVRVRAYLQAGGDVNAALAREPDGELTCGLHAAARGGHLEVAAKLLSVGADVALRSGRDQATALHVAACAGADAVDPRVVQLLLQVGADAHARDAATRRTPLLALAAACEAACKAAVTAGTAAGSAADAKAATSARDEGRGVYLAKKRARIAELLLAEGGAEVGASDRSGRTAMCYARAAGSHGALLLDVLRARYVMQATETPTEAGAPTEAAGSNAPALGSLVTQDEGPNACYRGPACTFCGNWWR
jgi:hypothetical protein